MAHQDDVRYGSRQCVKCGYDRGGNLQNPCWWCNHLEKQERTRAPLIPVSPQWRPSDKE